MPPVVRQDGKELVEPRVVAGHVAPELPQHRTSSVPKVFEPFGQARDRVGGVAQTLHVREELAALRGE
jgi:hypothetical protein